MKYANGNVYTGQWSNDLKSGKGHYKCVKEESWMDQEVSIAHEYDGEWLDDKYHGQGVITWNIKSKYVGSFKNGKFDGHGVRTWDDGARYDGQWKDGLRHVHGVHTYQNGSSYNGDW